MRTSEENTLSENIRLCLCGCPTKIPAYDKKGRPRFYAKGHNARINSKKLVKKYGFDKMSIHDMRDVFEATAADLKWTERLKRIYEETIKEKDAEIHKLKQELDSKDQMIADLEDVLVDRIPEVLFNA